MLRPPSPGAHLRQFDKNNIRQLALRVVADADGGDFAFDANPFVRFGMPDILGNRGVHKNNSESEFSGIAAIENIFQRRL